MIRASNDDVELMWNNFSFTALFIERICETPKTWMVSTGITKFYWIWLEKLKHKISFNLTFGNVIRQVSGHRLISVARKAKKNWTEHIQATEKLTWSLLMRLLFYIDRKSTLINYSDCKNGFLTFNEDDLFVCYIKQKSCCVLHSLIFFRCLRLNTVSIQRY